MKKIVFSIILLSFVTALKAQFEVSGVIRPRAEFRNGYKAPRNKNSKPAFFIGQRTRLSFGYENENIKTKLTLFDARVWGDNVWKKDNATTGIHEAWTEVNLSKSIVAKFGRQELKYDNSRLLSPVNWNNVGAAHDLLLFKYRKNDWTIDFGSAWNQSSEKSDGTNYDFYTQYYKNLNFLWASKKFGDLTISTLDIFDGSQDENIVEKLNYRITTGLKLDYKKEKFQTTIRAFDQIGKLQSGQEVSAWYTNVDLNFKASEKIQLNLGCEIKSGNDATDSLDLVDHRFDILLGGRHAFNGRIDYFNTPSSTKGAGLVDTYLKIDVKITEKTSLLSEYHYFMLQNNYIDNGNVIDKFLGHELDFTLKHKVNSDVSLEAGYAAFIGSSSLSVIKGGNEGLFNNWAYLMITVSPTFFKSEKK